MKPDQKKTAPCISVLGTGSDVGKSIVVTAICRFFLNRGIRVAPYKAQNMSNNSGVTPEGLEMGRAQIVQAEACRIPPHTDMNPILLKPTTDVGCQVVVRGEAVENSTALNYHKKKEHLFSTACQSLDRLRNRYELVVMEGAGSCAEVNLMAHDIVNFRMAEYADAPVILVADIHRGGVFAQIIGTLECLPQKQRERIAGFIINRFRGDIRLFQDGVKWIEERTGKKVFGVLPWFSHFRIEAEDSVVIESPPVISPEKITRPAIAVIRIPHISNFTDFDPLSAIEETDLFFMEKAQDVSDFAAVILPGSKNTRFDLDWLKETGWAAQLRKYAEKGGHILGICGGYQIMGDSVHDPDGLEGPPGSTEGLGLLPVETVLEAPKTTSLSRFLWQGEEGRGYEIHMGQTRRKSASALLRVLEQNGSPPREAEEGCISSDRKIMATYMHGFFDTPAITRLWLQSIGLGHIAVSDAQGGPAARDRDYDLLAEHFGNHIDTQAFLACTGISGKQRVSP
ncbi:MAG: cobyric acid synthase [Desulfococcaceae bacterium]|nr:cobyric acid synthase [Desulfococcaceae bacterium]